MFCAPPRTPPACPSCGSASGWWTLASRCSRPRRPSFRSPGCRQSRRRPASRSSRPLRRGHRVGFTDTPFGARVPQTTLQRLADFARVEAGNSDVESITVTLTEPGTASTVVTGSHLGISFSIDVVETLWVTPLAGVDTTPVDPTRRFELLHQCRQPARLAGNRHADPHPRRHHGHRQRGTGRDRGPGSRASSPVCSLACPPTASRCATRACALRTGPSSTSRKWCSTGRRSA